MKKYTINYRNVFKAHIRGISSIIIIKWIIVIWIFQIMWLISLNLAFKIANLDIFFIVVTIATIVATIIVSKILLSSWQCYDKPKSTRLTTTTTYSFRNLEVAKSSWRPNITFHYYAPLFTNLKGFVINVNKIPLKFTLLWVVICFVYSCKNGKEC